MVDLKYITNGIRVEGEGKEWELRSQAAGSWYAWSGGPGDREARELGQGSEAAARTLEAAGWDLAKGEEERYEYENAKVFGDRDELVRARIDYDEATGRLLPSQAIDAARQYEARQLAWSELGPDGQDEINAALDQGSVAAETWPDWEAQIAPEGPQIYTPTLREDLHPDAAPILREWLNELDYDHWSPSIDADVAEIDIDDY